MILDQCVENLPCVQVNYYEALVTSDLLRVKGKALAATKVTISTLLLILMPALAFSPLFLQIRSQGIFADTHVF